MSSHVGGRMEAKVPIRVTDWSDRARLLALFLIATFLHGWIIRNSVMTARDSLGFARQAVNLAHPSDGKPPAPPAGVKDQYDRKLEDVLKHAQQPPGYPATIYAVFYIVRAIDPPEWAPSIKPGEGTVLVRPIIHDQILFSAQLAAAIAMTFAVFPMYWLGRMLLDKNRSFAAVLIFQFLPVVARDTSDGLSEGLFFLGLSSALALGVAGIRKESIGRFLVCGLATGLTYLVRPEGLAVLIAGLAVLGWLLIAKLRPRGNMLACAAALIVGTGIAAAPYMLLIGSLTNKPSGKQATEEFSNPRLKAIGAQGRNVGLPLVAEWRRDGESSTPTAKILDSAKAIVREYFQASHYAVGILGLFGIAALWRRFRSEPEWLLLIAAAVIHLMALARVTYVQGYASERHLLSSAFVATYLTMAGLPTLFAWFARWPIIGPFYRRPVALWLWVVLLVAIDLPSLRKPLHENRIGFREGGLLLAKRMKLDEENGQYPQLTDPSEWVQYYAGRTYYLPPPETVDRKEGVEYAVHLPNRDNNDSRLNALSYTAEMANDPTAELIYAWPEGPEEKVKVKIYRRVNPPKLPPDGK